MPRMLLVVQRMKVERGGVVVPVAADLNGFEDLIHEHLQPAYRLALTILRDQGRAEDAVQEASVKAWKNIGGLRNEASLRSWFLAIVANQCRSSLRRRIWLPLSFGGLAHQSASADDVASQRVDVSRALGELGSDDRLAIYLYYYMDLPVADAARIVRVSESAFRSRLARAAKRMRPYLAAEESSDG